MDYVNDGKTREGYALGTAYVHSKGNGKYQVMAYSIREANVVLVQTFNNKDDADAKVNEINDE